MSPGKFSKLTVVFCILHLFVFTYICMILQVFFGIIVQDTLINCNFLFFGSELVGLLALKVYRVKKEDKKCQESETNL